MSKILIIDDEVDILDTVSAILQDEGYEVKTASHFSDALIKNELDIILLDVWLHNQSGLEILEKIRKESPHLPVLMISGHGNIEMAVEAVKKGAFDFLEKP